MFVNKASLLLAGLTFANAGIFQRQCYPSTVTVTLGSATDTGAAASAPIQATTITISSAQTNVPDTTSTVFISTTVTETTTVTPPTFTFTSTATNVITINNPTTVTQTVTGLSLKSPLAAESSFDIETQSSTAFPHAASPPVSATKTVHVVQTVTLIPIPATQNDASTYQSSSVPTGETTRTTIPTITVAVTTPSQGQETSGSASTFPTLSVTGSMGVTPSGFSGAATAGSTGFGTGVGTGVGTDSPRSGTGLPLISASAPLSVVSGGQSVPPFANSTSSNLAGVSTGTAASTGTATSTGGLTRRCLSPAKREVAKEKRQVGSVVTATIDGTVVSWTNSWDGIGTSTTVAPLINPMVVTATVQGVVVSWTETPSGAAASTVPEIPSVSPTGGLGGPVTVVPISAGTASSSLTSATQTAGTPVYDSASASIVTSATVSISTPSGPPPYVPPAWLTSDYPYPPVASSGSPSTIASSQIPTTMSSSSAASATSAQISTPATSSVSAIETTSSSATTSASSASASCTGRYNGNFTIDFDDLPRNGEPPSSNQYPPFQNPYNDLYWSQGFSYAPPPNDPYPPHSGSQLGVFVVDGNANVHSQNWTGPIPNDTDVNGMFGAGPNYDNPAFYIDAFGAWIGCQNSGPQECQIQVNGYALEEPSGSLALQAEQYFYQAPCTSNCALEYFQFGEAFRNLTAFQIQATHQGDSANTALTWYIDDISLAWSDNSCDAIQTRSQSAGHGGFGGFVKRQNADSKHAAIAWQGRVPAVPHKKLAPVQ